MDSNYWDIAAKVLEGRASPAEEEALRLWREADAANEEQYKAQAKLWQLTMPGPEEPVDIEAAWQKVSFRLRDRSDDTTLPTTHKQGGPQQAKSVSLFRMAMGVAASIALLLTLAWLVSFFLVPDWGKQVVKAGKEPIELVLPDGSKVMLNRNSKLVYEPEFSGTKRFMTLEGEAFFKVVRDEQRPFVIETGKVQTKVLGTSFNLRYYPEEQQTELIVISGKVAFTETEQSREAIVWAGQSAQVNLATGQLETFITANKNALAWQTGRLHFEARPLAEVLQQLERYYALELVLQNTEAGACRFTGTFNKAPLEEVLQVLKATLQLDIKQQKSGVFIISGEGCNL